MLRRTWAEIDVDAIEQNAKAIRRRLRPTCQFMGIIKADGYGHGAVPTAEALTRAGADWFGVSNEDEAVQLRRAGIDRPILVISYTPPTEAECLAQYGITQTVVSLDHARLLSAEAEKAGVTVSVHVKVDTGMSRVGFVCHTLEEADAVAPTVAELFRLPGLAVEGIFTHFAAADGTTAEEDAFTRHQFACFMRVTERVEAMGCHFALRHCCNSAAVLRYPEMHLDMVRPGIILYGLCPDSSMAEEMEGLTPVMQLKTTVSLVKELPADTPISYGCTHVTKAPIRVATVPIGYADGYLRAGSDVQTMLVNGKEAPVLGRICMDQCMLDVTEAGEVQPGDEVTVFGTSGGKILTADTVAARAGSIGYELVCGVTRRVPRVYRKNGETVLVTGLLPER